MREAWGVAGEDAAEPDGILRKGYRGCRYSFGYPACPALDDQKKLLDLLGAERIGVSLTESPMARKSDAWRFISCARAKRADPLSTPCACR